jgi:hypothetical protein
MRRDVLTRREDGVPKRSGLNKRDPFGKPEPRAAPEVMVRPELEPYEEPTWEVRSPGGRRRIDRRTRSILTVAAVTAIVVNAGAAWAYWKVTASETGSARAGTVVQLNLRGRSDLNKPLTRGSTGSLTVTLTNDNDFPIRITSVTPGPGNIVADNEHRDAGCLDTGVTVTKESFTVDWAVAHNTIGAFTLPDGLKMAASTSKACEGATFTVPVRTSGVSER